MVCEKIGRLARPWLRGELGGGRWQRRDWSEVLCMLALRTSCVDEESSLSLKNMKRETFFKWPHRLFARAKNQPMVQLLCVHSRLPTDTSGDMGGKSLDVEISIFN